MRHPVGGLPEGRGRGAKGTTSSSSGVGLAGWAVWGFRSEDQGGGGISTGQGAAQCCPSLDTGHSDVRGVVARKRWRSSTAVCWAPRCRSVLWREVVRCSTAVLVMSCSASGAKEVAVHLFQGVLLVLTVVVARHGDPMPWFCSPHTFGLAASAARKVATKEGEGVIHCDVRQRSRRERGGGPSWARVRLVISRRRRYVDGSGGPSLLLLGVGFRVRLLIAGSGLRVDGFEMCGGCAPPGRADGWG